MIPIGIDFQPWGANLGDQSKSEHEDTSELALTDEQIGIILQRALSWAWVVQDLSQGPPDDTRPTLHLGHLLVIALEHLSNCARLLAPVCPPEVATAADDFGTAWAKDREIRNFLEHEEEYLVGRGLRRSKLSDPSLADSPRGLVYAAGRAQALWVVGEKLVIPPHVAVAAALQAALAKWYDARVAQQAPE